MKVLIYLFEGFELLELATFTDVFGWNNILNKDKIYFKTISHKNVVKALWGGELIPNISLEVINLNDYDILIIPGGFGRGGYFKDKSVYFDEILRHFISQKKIIVAICTAAIKLVENRSLENIKITTYMLEDMRYFKQLSNYNVTPVYEEIVMDENIISCSGPGNVKEISLYLVEKFFGKENSEKISKNMMF